LEFWEEAAPLTSWAKPESRRYVVGPTLEVGLPLGFALEGDALYHRHRYIWATGNFAGFDTELERANGGTVNLQTGAVTPFSGNANTNWSASYGAIVGGGLRFSLGRLQLSPQVRYTHWTSTPINFINDQGLLRPRNRSMF
jgi:hypothetical protein